MTTIPALAGQLVRLEALTEGHAPALLDSITSEEVWAWKPVPRPRNVDDMRTLTTGIMAGTNGTRHPLAVIRRSDGIVVGSTTLHSLDLKQGRAEIGWTWLDRRCWGQGYNEDMKRVLLSHCFGPLGLHRVQWTVDGANLRSQRALERLGFTKEGTLRSHRVRVDHTRADTVIYSILAGEWPAADARLRMLIDDRTP